MQIPATKRYATECIGTFILIFAGCGAMTINAEMSGAVTHVGIGLTWGLIVMALIYAIGDNSGAHINPAVTLGFAIARRFPWAEVPGYITAQLAGAFAASITLRLIFPDAPELGETLPANSHLQAAVLEVFLSFILMYIILGVATGAKEKGLMAGVAIGAVVGLEAIFAGPICRASMNPARSIGPAVVSMNPEALAALWYYILSPIVGMAMAVAVFKLTQPPELESHNDDLPEA